MLSASQRINTSNLQPLEPLLHRHLTSQHPGSRFYQSDLSGTGDAAPYESQVIDIAVRDTNRKGTSTQQSARQHFHLPNHPQIVHCPVISTGVHPTLDAYFLQENGFIRNVCLEARSSFCALLPTQNSSCKFDTRSIV